MSSLHTLLWGSGQLGWAELGAMFLHFMMLSLLLV